MDRFGAIMRAGAVWASRDWDLMMMGEVLMVGGGKMKRFDWSRLETGYYIRLQRVA